MNAFWQNYTRFFFRNHRLMTLPAPVYLSTIAPFLILKGWDGDGLPQRASDPAPSEEDSDLAHDTESRPVKVLHVPPLSLYPY